MTRQATSDPTAAAEVFFDGGCPICRREIAAYRGMAGLEDVIWRDVSDPACAPQGLDRAAALARFHVRRGDGTIVAGARAFLAIWRRTPRLARLAQALDRRPVTAVLDLGYAAFLRLRPLWRRP
jgi:predicted DCC family thiol-disulfide oxidoreductase YuxK